MSIEAMKQAIEALNEAVAFREGGRQKAIDAINALRAAIQQAEAKTDEPAAYVCPTSHHAHDGSMEDGPDYLEWADEASDYEKRVGTPLYTHPAPGVPELSRIAKRKLDELQEQGFAITGYAIQSGPVRGFIDGGGFVGWWQCEPDPGLPDDVARDAERLNELEALVQSKGTHGLSFDYCKHVEDGYVVEKGFRVMWRHHLGERKPTLREAIDAASPAQKGGAA